jgi:molybdopterin/thiamine biosynthesis adenylyltransferase/rhodanese-related sulfurtransferase
MDERYQRQMCLPGMGTPGQARLRAARVLVIGAGGLGCPVLQYLTAAGVGTLGIVDNDQVELSNLHRQVLYHTVDIGTSKAICAAARLKAMNSDVHLIPFNDRITASNAADIIAGFDIVVDASDNFPTRYLLNDACYLLHKPLVYGAIHGFEGQVAVWRNDNKPALPGGYRDLFPDPPANGLIANCAGNGVIGVLAGIIGTLQAGEVIKIITGIGAVLDQKLLTYNWSTQQFWTFELEAGNQVLYSRPQDLDTLKNWAYDDELECDCTAELNMTGLRQLLSGGGVTVVDVRLPHEEPVITDFETVNIPLPSINRHSIPEEVEACVFVCNTGKRSREAARIAAGFWPGMKVYNLKNGLLAEDFK